MKTKFLFLTALACLAVLPATAEPQKDAEGFTPLFNGKTLDGWKNPYTWGEAKVVDGEIHLSADKKFFFITTQDYGDFVFEGEVKLPEGKANSGFIFRGKVEPNKVYGYQAEVDGDVKRMWSGGLYDEGRRKWFISPKRGDKVSEAAFKKRSKGAFKRNGWNKYRISCKGNKISIEVNGVIVTDIEDDKDATGPIGIQHHGEKGAIYKFRNLRIRKLK